MYTLGTLVSAKCDHDRSRKMELEPHFQNLDEIAIFRWFVVLCGRI